MYAIRQEVMVQEDGILRIHAVELRHGDVAEVTVRVKKREPIGGENKPNWRDFIGTFESGDPDGSDNEKIDRDLAQAYLDDHEPPK